jgi:hypothetical protein
MSNHSIAKSRITKFLTVDVAGIGGRKKLLPGEVSE